MFKCSLHNVVEQMKTQIARYDGFWNGNKERSETHESMKKVVSESENAMCFSIGDVESIEGMKIVPELVRLPYEYCWFEFSYKKLKIADQTDYGVFAKQEKDDISFVYFTRFADVDFSGWMCVGSYTASQLIEMDVSYQKHGFDACLAAVFHAYVVGVFLSALNCVNVKKIKNEPSVKLQKARAKRGKKPLFSFWTLELSFDRYERGQDLGGTHASPRLHLRKGHPRRVGAGGDWTWVRPHAVGNKKLGMVHKEYALVQ